MRKSIMTVPLPPSITRAKSDPIRITSSPAPMTRRSRGPKAIPTVPKMAATANPRRIDWIAARAAPSRSFSPIRRATTAAAPIESPIASAYITVISDSVMPTVATASGPRRPTKNTSATTNTDSISISRTIGTASRTTARPMGASV
jgi:hypothetical protein